MARVPHKAIASCPKLALDWLIMQGYTRKAASRQLARCGQPPLTQEGRCG